MNPQVLDRLAIRDLIDNWAVWRDAGDWERFATVWHDDGVMMATWFTEAAERMGLSQPDVSRLLRGNFREVSVERLMRMLTKLGYDVDIVVRSAGRTKRAGDTLHLHAQLG